MGYTLVIELVFLSFSKPNVQGIEFFSIYVFLIIGLFLNGYTIKYYSNLTMTGKRGLRGGLYLFFLVFYGEYIDLKSVEFRWSKPWIGNIVSQNWFIKFTYFILLCLIITDLYMMAVEDQKSDDKANLVGNQELD